MSMQYNAPTHTAGGTASDAGLPQQRAGAGIERIGNARFLTRQQHLAPGGVPCQHYAGSEVEVGPFILGAGVAGAEHASDVPRKRYGRYLLRRQRERG